MNNLKYLFVLLMLLVVNGCGSVKNARYKDVVSQSGKYLVTSAGYIYRGDSGITNADLPPEYPCSAEAMLTYVGAAYFRVNGNQAEEFWGNDEYKSFRERFASVSKDELKQSIREGKVLFPEMKDMLVPKGAKALIVFTGRTFAPVQISRAPRFECGRPVEIKQGFGLSLPMLGASLALGQAFNIFPKAAANTGAGIYIIDNDGVVVYYDSFFAKEWITNLDKESALSTVKALAPSELKK